MKNIVQMSIEELEEKLRDVSHEMDKLSRLKLAIEAELIIKQHEKYA